jgi:hypothetical protein
MATLYELEWRQGSLFAARLPRTGLILGPAGSVETEAASHESWVVAAQDCDLNSWPHDDPSPVVEIRPVFPFTGPADWGIRSRRLLISDSTMISAAEAPVHLSPAALSAVSGGGPGSSVDDDRAVALKTWLGFRYDRPAVPDALVPLARDIAVRARRRQGRAFATDLHEVLVQYDDRSTPPRFVLFAVVRDGANRQEARRWLTTIGTAVPPDLGVLGGVDAGYRSETSLELIETSFAADVTQLSWSGPGPTGAI